MTELTLKCKCGSFEATFDAPPRVCFNCQCHSCVSAIKTIEAKEGFDGTSMKQDDREYSGVAIAIFKSNNTTIKTIDGSKIGFVKVGENGPYPRPYCTQCGTVLFNVYMPNWSAANLNAITNADGTAWKPAKPVMNTNCKNAFDPESVPEPKQKSIPFGFVFSFIPTVLGLRCDGSNADTKELIPDLDKVEVCPITWE
mmetsp:Transcript_23255/g.39752  ORF Transcript_23255/g.39752 Transcript_23255/m.39752 type:complete len:198 (-) Transcript_23255:269-862(-)|eukprot:CAMPEP_0183702536 /NCGR_PEP_ID=MMETSP0737-20130205/607_1 /TAXON_ID=385413 /ORGANISM="Thalassiosira miniscula, Strain CCMP1093" /LENGTH=197 /DNA_ID=CAMNT_0025929155 /DNA_START=38 /DNA_END=631 /DNA_ORIENTATION=-